MTIEEKLLITIYSLSIKTENGIDLDDVIVQSHKLFPENFSLKKYPKYPDSASISKRLYDRLKPNGYIIIRNLKVKLTDHGRSIAEQVYNNYYNKKSESHNESIDISRNENIELKRLLSHKGFCSYFKNNESNILDIDVFDFFQISARTKNSDVKNRISMINALMGKIKNLKDIRIKILSEYYKLLLDKYKEFQV